MTFAEASRDDGEPDPELEYIEHGRRPSDRQPGHNRYGRADIQPRCFCASCVAARPESRAFLAHEKKALSGERQRSYNAAYHANRRGPERHPPRPRRWAP